jgi:hypothetical protein
MFLTADTPSDIFIERYFFHPDVSCIDWGLISCRTGLLSSQQHPDSSWTHSAFCPVETWVLCLGLEWPGNEADHLPLTSSAVA